MTKQKWSFLWIILLGMVLSGCGVIDTVFLNPPQDTALELLEAGNMAMEEKDYDQAISYYTKLKDQYPFSPYTSQAELRLADAYFQDQRYAAAENAYKEFESLHPGHEDIAYVLFRIGLSNFKQFKSIDLPQDNVTEAMQYFNRVAEAYPQAPVADQAREYVRKCQRFQAEHEIFVADFYWRTERYLSAWKRYAYVADNFSMFQDILTYARTRSRLAYVLHQRQAAERERIAQYGSWKQLFDWL
ncbi:outer membrane protein assembly factor BamD [Desulfovermiculus halophilus]|jgi:outer membrane protein assembly factor BamD|uniref:outer membrane protein assembly factor BamD n=1 Tax=Desulfovermiculus halophilus TaxID=339722 RepID=UPI000480BA97|nr:outer membrane protein assembly factor BamD [Desulfovermiculus halophilus]